MNSLRFIHAPMTMTILSIVGTRPEAIKMAPVIRELARGGPAVRTLTCLTGQHRDLTAPILDLFGIQPDYRLDTMRPGQSLARLSAALFQQLDGVMAETRPDWVLAQGDTTTVLAASLVAYYHRARFGHVEAGLRTGHKFRPFPEELNRRVADVVDDVCFAPTERARDNLLREGFPAERIHVTGNTSVDALLEIAARPFDWERSRWSTLAAAGPLVVVTAHRRESVGVPLREICAAIRELALHYGPGGVQFVFPVHLNPEVNRPVRRLLAGLDNVSLVEPLDYLTMVHLMKRAKLVMTDSGGIQEEAPSLGVRVVVMREVTERPEGVEAGWLRLAGTTRAGIVAETRSALDAPGEIAGPGSGVNPFGDGQAARRIVSVLLQLTRPERSEPVEQPRPPHRNRTEAEIGPPGRPW
jgi:UDP-N-acetylglucosamine 2-epimerase